MCKDQKEANNRTDSYVKIAEPPPVRYKNNRADAAPVRRKDSQSTPDTAPSRMQKGLSRGRSRRPFTGCGRQRISVETISFGTGRISVGHFIEIDLQSCTGDICRFSGDLPYFFGESFGIAVAVGEMQ